MAWGQIGCHQPVRVMAAPAWYNTHFKKKRRNTSPVSARIWRPGPGAEEERLSALHWMLIMDPRHSRNLTTSAL
ncbi:Hypothetical predicted protein [Scomber scombrus]|uniref:Uncharacterized protein n=1 Tax=Scomber scombrus TaxID=13677 RepID=A0AAV1NKE7_SCOSC